jgi:hypothetical protein
MHCRTLAFAALALAATAAPAFADDALRIEHAAARLVVIPEARADVVYTIQPGRSDLPPIKARRDGGVLVLDGGLGGGFMGHSRIRGCDGWGVQHVQDEALVWRSPQRKSVRIEGLGSVKLEDLPTITAHVPLDAKVAAGEAVFGQIGPSRSLDLGAAGCGDWSVAEVKGLAKFALSGSGDVWAKSAGETHAAISGSGDVHVGAVNGALHAAIAGSGDVKVGRLDGPLSAKIAGSGDVIVDGGHAPTLAAEIAGSGDVKFRGEAGAVNASIVGSGDVDVARATGPVAKHVAGSGEVNVGR